MKQIIVVLNDKLGEKFEKYIKESGKCISGVIRLLIEEEVKKWESGKN